MLLNGLLILLLMWYHRYVISLLLLTSISKCVWYITGKDLKETWIVVNAATYFWNYNNHMITQNKHRDIYGQLQIILDGLKKAGHDGWAIVWALHIRKSQ